MSEAKNWGMVSKDDYFASDEDGPHGLSLQPEAKIPGYVNILMLMTSTFDEAAQWRGSVDDCPCRSGATSYAAAMALQPDHREEGVTLGDRAETMSPRQFFEYIKDRDDLIPVKTLGPSVLEVMRQRSEFLQAQYEAKNIVRVNFRERLRLQ